MEDTHSEILLKIDLTKATDILLLFKAMLNAQLLNDPL
jgi:hypothetical protein